MVGHNNVRAVIGVRNLESATRFYGGILGLRVESENPYEVVYLSGDSELSIYMTALAGTNKATAATWRVSDIDAEVEELKGKGVVFEHYDDMEGVTREGEVHVMDSERAAWFKDPDGNILCLHTED